jgi:hypothetical protein
MAADPDTDAYDYDDQDQSELFDEDNVDEQGGSVSEFKTFEEIPDVLDVTQKIGDSRDLEAADAADFTEGLVDDEDLEEEDEFIDDDVYDEHDEADVEDRDEQDGVDELEPDEVELAYAPDLTDRRGAQASAAHFESRAELADDDVEELGYAADLEEE